MLDLWNWIVSPSVTSVVTWVGTIFGLLGLGATYRQATVARKAAQAAVAAVRMLQGKLGLSNLAHSYSQVGLIQNLLNGGNIGAAQMLFHPLKRELLEACHLLRDRDDLAEAIATIRRNVRLVEHQFIAGVQEDSTYSLTRVTKALTGIGDFLVDREQELKYSQSEN